MSRLHTDGETQVGDDDDIPSLHVTRPTGAFVPNLDDNEPDNDDSDELPDFFEH